jgi:outer membrane protein assembly factor BamB
VYALDARTGRVRWKHQTGNVVHASPAVTGGVVYVGSWDTYFYALDAATGRVRWRFKTGEDAEIHNQEGIASSAAVVGGAVYFGCRDGHLYALDAATGAKRWSFATGGGWVIASPAVRGNRVYMATADGRWFRELDTETGTSLFQQQFSWYLFASPAIADSVAYIAGWDGRLAAIDLATRQTLWTFQTDASKQNIGTWTNAAGAMVFRGNQVVDRTGWADEMALGVNLSLTSLGAFVSSPVLAGGVLYIGSMDGHLYAIM